MSNELPVQWKEVQLSQLLKANSLFSDGDWVESKDQDPEGSNRLLQLADIGDGQFLDKSNRFLNDKQFTLLRCTPLIQGDILIARMPDPIGRACLFPAMPMRCATIVDVAILRNADANSGWLVAAINSDAFRRKIELSSCGTTRTRISRSLLTKLKLLVPPPEIQKSISTILYSIDTAIEKTESLIAKYQQIKAGLMHDLFTRGVLPSGQLRPPREQAPELYQETAIGWIPREWNVSKLGTMAKIVSGVTLGSKESSTDTIDAPYLRVANVQDGYLDLTEIKTVRVSHKTLEYLRLIPGDVLMNEGGDFDKLGRGAVWAGEIEGCVHQNHVFRVRADSTILRPYYLAYYSESSFGKKYFLLSSKQSTNLASINSTQLNAYPIALPPSCVEQDAIIQRVSGANSRINALKAEVEKLRAQKLGLMHDLLTGKVPVTIEEPEVVDG
jgi:type I restriction enzyme S subunit